MPPESIWLQFSIIAIVVLAIGIVWREMRKFIEEQDTKREAEREKQRVWQAQQNKMSDERWQGFIQTMQAEWLKEDGRHSDVLQEMIERLDELLKKHDKHDLFVQNAISEMRGRTQSLKGRE